MERTTPFGHSCAFQDHDGAAISAWKPLNNEPYHARRAFRVRKLLNPSDGNPGAPWSRTEPLPAAPVPERGRIPLAAFLTRSFGL